MAPRPLAGIPGQLKAPRAALAWTCTRGSACVCFLHLHRRQRRARGRAAGIDGAAPTFAPPARRRKAYRRIHVASSGPKTPQRASKALQCRAAVKANALATARHSCRLPTRLSFSASTPVLTTAPRRRRALKPRLRRLKRAGAAETPETRLFMRKKELAERDEARADLKPGASQEAGNEAALRGTRPPTS